MSIDRMLQIDLAATLGRARIRFSLESPKWSLIERSHSRRPRRRASQLGGENKWSRRGASLPSLALVAR